MADSPHYIFRERPSLNDIEVVSCAEIEEIYKDGVKAPPVMSLYEPTKHSPVDSRLMDMIRGKWGRRSGGRCRLSGERCAAQGARGSSDGAGWPWWAAVAAVVR